MSDLRSRALAMLARREHSRAELVGKLSGYGSTEEIDRVIADLQASRLLSDARFAEAYLRAKGERLGPARLRQTLRQKGVDAETIATQMAAAELPDELTQARAVWRKKFASAPAPGDAKEWARQARFLQSRGFGSDAIRRLLKTDPSVEGEE